VKVALIHDFLVEYGGAERVLEALHEIYPRAPIYTAFYDKNGPGMERFNGFNIKTSWLQKIPLSRTLLSPFRLFSLALFESFDLNDFDLVISSTWMYMAKGVITRPESLHVCYMHTPPRFLYGYKTARDWRKYWWGRVVGSLLNHKMRAMDFVASQRPDYLIANSQFTADRIWKFYRRKAKVIYPPVELAGRSHPGNAAKLALSAAFARRSRPRRSYFLCVSRLARAKRIDLAIKACHKLGLNLWVVGCGREEKYLESIAGKTIKFLGYISDKHLAEVYANCQAVIFPAEDEDFGIVPVEAMSFGKPVIALRSGGTVESIIDPTSAKAFSGQGPTGVFFDEPTVESLIKSLKEFKSLKFKRSDCVRQAEKFSEERFKREIKNFVYGKIKEKQGRRSGRVFGQSR
jgi:glycosyltransferase involved in cell wall biosynthesis